MPRDTTEEWWNRWQWLDLVEPPDLASRITKAVLNDLGGRRGIKWELQNVDMVIVRELLMEVNNVVRTVLDADKESP